MLSVEFLAIIKTVRGEIVYVDYYRGKLTISQINYVCESLGVKKQRLMMKMFTKIN